MNPATDARDGGEDDLDEDDDMPRFDCGRWDNGQPTRSCSLAGTEECEFECPYRRSQP
jgi:hypothetical protein